MSAPSKRVICPVCRFERWVNVSDVLHIRQILQGSLISVALAGLLFQWIEYRVVVIPCLIWIAFEAARSIINRRKLVCPRCDFDPFLYKMNRRLARERCEKRLQEIAPSKAPDLVPPPAS